MTFEIAALAVSLATLAFVLWNGWQIRKHRLRAQAFAQKQLATLKAERLHDELRRRDRQ